MAEQAKPPEVVFVDDDPAVRAVVGYDFPDWCVLAEGAAAVQLLRQLVDQGTPALVLVTDQRMPEMSGVQLCAQARLISPSTARVLLTAYHDCSLEVGVNVGGIERVVSKPYDRDVLAAAVGALAERRRAPSSPRLPCVTDAQIFGQQARDRLARTSGAPPRGEDT
jgi:CheY-like chemotaxis protein